ncbi:FecR family protein [uncultured Chitinophaga sp.]|uniref:FecR family protein n=1 Tax=uncultured Chitinophaga sp. TaxID=339340 RepID=UPI002629B34B|nr:FecR family protein [uncultured Chitinophaga sp.]
MHTDDTRYKALIRRWFNGGESDDEARELHALLQDSGRYPELMSALEAEYGSLDVADFPEARAKALAGQITGSPVVERKGRVRFLRGWRLAAASVALVVGVAAYFWSVREQDQGAPAGGAEAAIQPGRQGALLTLADGSQVSLDTVQNGTIALQGGVAARVVNGVLTYEGDGTEIVYNTISTPKGRQYHITLPDGSGIWLNAASSIRYPVSFAKGAREVAITGEVYFEIVAGKARPFTVLAGDKARVQVLGTRFNINAYENEKYLAATLLEGKVRTIPGRDAAKAGVILRPGQQAQIAGTMPSGISVTDNADIEKVMAWKNGLFNFNGATLAEVMQQLERWYDIEVVYENGVPDKKLTGKMTRDIPLEGLLLGLQELGVNCRLEGRRLTVLP